MLRLADCSIKSDSVAHTQTHTSAKIIASLIREVYGEWNQPSTWVPAETVISALLAFRTEKLACALACGAWLLAVILVIPSVRLK